MKITMTIWLALALAAISTAALAQDPDAAAERARLANQRILAESEQKKRDAADSAEPKAALDEVSMSAAVSASAPRVGASPAREQPVVATPEAAAAPEAAAESMPLGEDLGAAAPGPAGDVGMSTVLEQLKALGELKDAGYVTSDEFERIKQRILEENL